MLEDLDKLILAGLGALSMTRAKAEKIFDEYVQRGQEARGNRAGFVKDLADSAEKAKADLERMISKHVAQVLKKLDVPTRQDLAHLEAKINALKSGKKR